MAKKQLTRMDNDVINRTVADSQIPLLSVQGYAKKGPESKKLAEEISTLLINYQKETAIPKSLYTYSLSKRMRVKRMKQLF